MPMYEYECQNCKCRFVDLLSQGTIEVGCPRCGSKQTNRLVSKFRMGRSEGQRLDEMADRIENTADPESPTELKNLMREMGKALDEDLSDDMEQVFEDEIASSSNPHSEGQQ